MSLLDEQILEQRPGFIRARFTELDGEYELTCSVVLVQAVGECCGTDFYFRAKYGEWEFETEDKQGHVFPPDDLRYFVRRGDFDEEKPGTMELEWGVRMLHKCIAEWWGGPTGAQSERCE